MSEESMFDFLIRLDQESSFKLEDITIRKNPGKTYQEDKTTYESKQKWDTDRFLLIKLERTTGSHKDYDKESIEESMIEGAVGKTSKKIVIVKKKNIKLTDYEKLKEYSENPVKHSDKPMHTDKKIDFREVSERDIAESLDFLFHSFRD